MRRVRAVQTQRRIDHRLIQTSHLHARNVAGDANDFVAAGPGNDADYLTDGVSEALINGLTRLPNLRVTSRSVVFRYKGKQDVDPQQIGRDLNVKAIVTGRVSLRNDRLVIGAELMRVSDGAQLWGISTTGRSRT